MLNKDEWRKWRSLPTRISKKMLPMRAWEERKREVVLDFELEVSRCGMQREKGEKMKELLLAGLKELRKWAET